MLIQFNYLDHSPYPGKEQCVVVADTPRQHRLCKTVGMETVVSIGFKSFLCLRKP